MASGLLRIESAGEVQANPESVVTAMNPLVAPAPGAAKTTPHQQALRFRLRLLQADVSNFFLLQYSQVDGFLVTAKNSGTHWFKFMLSCAIAAQHGLAPPEHSNGREGDAIIGHPRWPRRYPQLPRIGSSHNIPSRAFICPVLRRILPYRPTIVLVRDIHQAMLSNFLKWRDKYGVTLSEYVQGDASGRRYVADAWW